VEEKYLLLLLVAFIQRLFPSTIVSSIARGTRGRVCHTDISLLTSMLILDTIFTTTERERGSLRPSCRGCFVRGCRNRIHCSRERVSGSISGRGQRLARGINRACPLESSLRVDAALISNVAARCRCRGRCQGGHEGGGEGERGGGGEVRRVTRLAQLCARSRQNINLSLE
jgi:hypothetical protein